MITLFVIHDRFLHTHAGRPIRLTAGTQQWSKDQDWGSSSVQEDCSAARRKSEESVRHGASPKKELKPSLPPTPSRLYRATQLFCQQSLAGGALALKLWTQTAEAGDAGVDAITCISAIVQLLM
jgi:hypothetical protein